MARIQKLVTLPPKLYELIMIQANNLGLSFPEYVRYTLTKVAEKTLDDIPMVDEATEKRIGQALKDLEEGRYTDIDPSDPIQLEIAAGLR